MGKWTPEETEFLTKNRSSMKFKEIAAYLNRSIGSIAVKAKTLKLKKASKVIIGMKVNRLKVMVKLEDNLYECLCKCGKTIQVDKCRLYGKESIKSCGCHKKVSPRLPSLVGLTPDMYSFRYLFARYMWGARNKEIIFLLTFNEFIEMIKTNCAYCGVEPRPFNAWTAHKHRKTPEEFETYWIKANGVDRIKNEDGYKNGNVLPCCKECNYAKGGMTASEWSSYLDRICNYRAAYKLQHGIDEAVPPMVATL
jgi:hypothetical protein